jgi:hypothetical protein
MIGSALSLLVGLTAGCGGGSGDSQLNGASVLAVQNKPQGQGALRYCSPLNFDRVRWAPGLSPQAARSLAIAMSASGSYEGVGGWQTLSNNFDGMGLSAGLLNQNLGSGSLQPLLARLLRKSPGVIEAHLSAVRAKSLEAMVEQWIAARGFQVQGIEDSTSSRLDAETALTVETVSPERVSVAWAVKNLYQLSKAFVPEWRDELQALLADPAYVSEQVAAAEASHQKALGYVRRLGLNDLRAYLVMFDVVIQDGGITEAEFARWDTIAAKLKTEVEQLKAMVDIRIARVLGTFASDVRSRKYALIDGSGFVHGELRRPPAEYCYAATDPIE